MRAGLARSDDVMAKDPRDFEKRFSEIINSEDLKKFSETFKKDSLFSYEDLFIIQQTLLESLSHVTDIIYFSFKGHNDIVDFSDPTQTKILSALYKVAIDFNDFMVEDMLDDLDDEEEENG